jgi:MFS family permease
MFGYGFLAVVLVLYLDAAGLDPLAIGVVLTLTLVGDAIVSLWLTTHADRLGRRRVLIISSVLVVVAGIVFALTNWLPLLVVAGIVGVISPTGNEVGPFLAVEQASLSASCSSAGAGRHSMPTGRSSPATRSSAWPWPPSPGGSGTRSRPR